MANYGKGKTSSVYTPVDRAKSAHIGEFFIHLKARINEYIPQLSDIRNFI
jgi:hypothetical protein